MIAGRARAACGASLGGMAARADTLDLARMRLASGEGRRLDLEVPVGGFSYGGQHYVVAPPSVPVTLDVSRTTHDGHALRLRFAATIVGPCMRCLGDASPSLDVDVREVDQPGQGDELESPYVADDVLDLEAWARDGLALTLPQQVLCRPECAGLCAVCGESLNDVGPDHGHAPEADPRWAKLRELRLE